MGLPGSGSIFLRRLLICVSKRAPHALVGIAHGFLEQFIAREGMAYRRHQHMEQRELSACQFNGFIVYREAVLVGVKDKAAYAQLRGWCDPAELHAAEQSAHAGDDLDAH